MITGQDTVTNLPKGGGPSNEDNVPTESQSTNTKADDQNPPITTSTESTTTQNDQANLAAEEPKKNLDQASEEPQTVGINDTSLALGSTERSTSNNLPTTLVENALDNIKSGGKGMKEYRPSCDFQDPSCNIKLCDPDKASCKWTPCDPSDSNCTPSKLRGKLQK